MGIRSARFSAGLLAAVLLIAPGIAAAQSVQDRAGRTVWFSYKNVARMIQNVPEYQAETTAKINSPLAKPAGTRYVPLRPKISASSLGRMAKTAVRRAIGPLGLIMLAAGLAEWLFDEDGSVTGQPRTFYKPSATGDFWCHVGPEHCAPDLGALLAVEQSHHVGKQYAGHTIASIEFTFCRDRVDGVPTKCTVRATMEGGTTADMHSVQLVRDYTQPKRLMSDEEMADALDSHNSADQVADDLAERGIRRGVGVNPSPETDPILDAWPEAKDALRDLDAQIESAEEAADINNDGQLSPEEIDQAQPWEEDQPSDPPETETQVEVNVDIPTGCDLLPAVCEIRDWLLEPPAEEPEQPAWQVNMIEPTDMPDAPNHLPSSAASCPSDTIEVLDITIPVPYQPFCDLAVMVKPLVIAGAWLVAIFLVVRK